MEEEIIRVRKIKLQVDLNGNMKMKIINMKPM